METRTFKAELRAENETKTPVMVGYAAMFNKQSENLGGFREVIAPGAFDAVLNDDVRALQNHDSNLVLGRSKSGTLRMTQDGNGLNVEIDPPDTQYCRDLLTCMKRGDVDQMSFSFDVEQDGQTWAEQPDGTYLRTITRFSRLYDVSVVTRPAYPDTSVAVRSLEQHKAAQVPAFDPMEIAAKKQRLASITTK